jgi:MT0933-like antitoxin protein
MGISDKVNKQLHKVKGKVAEMVDQHDEKIEATIEKTANLANEKTGGKHTNKIKAAADKAKGVVGSLGGGDKPAGSA